MPNPTVVVGVWPVALNPASDPPEFQVTVSLSAEQLADPTNALVLAQVHKTADVAIFQRHPEAALVARIAPFIGVSIPHTFTPHL